MKVILNTDTYLRVVLEQGYEPNAGSSFIGRTFLNGNIQETLTVKSSESQK